MPILVADSPVTSPLSPKDVFWPRKLCCVIFVHFIGDSEMQVSKVDSHCKNGTTDIQEKENGTKSISKPFLCIKRLSPKAILPSKASPLTVGYDLFSSYTCMVSGHGKARVETVDDVRNRGDLAGKDLTARFNGVMLDKILECVVDLSDPELDLVVQATFDMAYDNIQAFHGAQQIPEKIIENIEGVRCKRVAKSIHAVGLYVPGGTAVLPSTALMLVVPAHIAGCKLIILATPPRHDGSICKEVPYCAKKTRVTHILKSWWCSGSCSHGLGHWFLSKGGENPRTWKSICYSIAHAFFFVA